MMFSFLLLQPVSSTNTERWSPEGTRSSWQQKALLRKWANIGTLDYGWQSMEIKPSSSVPLSCFQHEEFFQLQTIKLCSCLLTLRHHRNTVSWSIKLCFYNIPRTRNTFGQESAESWDSLFSYTALPTCQQFFATLHFSASVYRLEPQQRLHHIY